MAMYFFLPPLNADENNQVLAFIYPLKGIISNLYPARDIKKKPAQGGSFL